MVRVKRGQQEGERELGVVNHTLPHSPIPLFILIRLALVASQRIQVIKDHISQILFLNLHNHISKQY